MIVAKAWHGAGVLVVCAVLSAPGPAHAEEREKGQSLYAGVDVLNVEGNDVPARIQGPNPAGVGVDGAHEDRPGYRLHLGYQWPDGWAVEGALLDLGDADIDLLPNGATRAELRQAAEHLHPQTARGLQLGIRRSIAIAPDWRLSFGGGFWYWRSEWDIPIGGANETFDDTGFGPALNLAAGWQVTERVELNARWDWLDFGDGGIRTLGLGVSYQWPR